MKSFIFSTLIAFMLAGCTVTYDTHDYGESLYVHGSYGWIVHDFELAYSYDYFQGDSLYFETPYLERGDKVYVDVYNDFDYAYIEYDSWRISLSDQWFYGAYEAHYVFEADESGYHYFALHELHQDSVVHVSYQQR